jgi:hypothetical protein
LEFILNLDGVDLSVIGRVFVDWICPEVTVLYAFEELRTRGSSRVLVRVVELA